MEQSTLRDEIEIDLKEIFRALLAKLWLIIFLGIIGGIGMLIYTKYMIAPIYSSTTKVYVLNRQNTDSNVTYTDLQTGAQLTKDYVELVKSRTVLTQVVEQLDLQMSPDALGGMVEAATATDTRIITITVNSTDIYQAQKIANTLREVASAHICKVMNLESVNTVDEANLPTSPSSPNVKKNILMGFGVGFFLGIVVVLVIYLLDDSIRTPDDVERYLNVGVLASIPILEDEPKRKKKKQRKNISELEQELMNQEEEYDKSIDEQLED